MTTQIAPSLGAGILETQQGVGAAPGYAAIDDRRMAGFALSQGPVGSGYGGGAGSGAYAVTQRQAGANLSVDIAASTGGGLAVAGTTIANQGLYIVPPHSAVINEPIAANTDPTNPRVDQIIVQCFDNAIDSSSNNKAQTTVLAGTVAAGATIGIGGNRAGAAALPANCYRLADVLVPPASGSITNAAIFDRRPKTRGHTNIATQETRTNVAYGTMPTPDQVTEIVLPTDGLIAVAYQALWQESVLAAARAAIFIGTSQQQVQSFTPAVGPQTVAAVNNNSGLANTNRLLMTASSGLGAVGTAATAADIATGQAIGAVVGTTGLNMEVGGTLLALQGSQNSTMGGPCYIFATAGTYHISVQYKASSGNVLAQGRRLWVWTMAPDQAVLA